MKNLSLSILTALCSLSLSAQTVYPTPQKVERGRGDVEFTKLSIQTKIDTTIQAEGYVLDISKRKVIITAADSRGEFYAKQTLNQLVENGKVPIIKITDYPTVRFRGVVEGFYGKPWSHRDRLAQFAFYGKNKLNTYIYGPKDDPYHSAPNWRKPYPKKEAAQIAELAKVAKANHVDFVWAIHPGQDIKWNDEDFGNLLGKFNAMYDLGVRSFAIFFDDISGAGTNPTRQAELLNRLNREFVKVKGDVTPLIMCPTEYNKSWANPSLTDSYLVTLGKMLDPDIQIMWTGDSVCADITTETLNWINERIGREAYIWWNFPVTDYIRHIVAQGPSYGLTKEAKGRMSGFTSNPMENAEASKIALFGVADYTWNPEAYHYLKTWNASFAHIMPQAADGYRNFAIHSSSLDRNGHGFDREESWLTDVNKSEDLKKAFTELIAAEKLITQSGADQFLVAELQPWLDQAVVVGQTGIATLRLAESAKSGDARQIWIGYLESELDADGQKQYAAHKVGLKKLMPWINSTRDSIGGALYTSLGGRVGQNQNPKAKIYTNIERLKAQSVSDIANVITISPVLEQITIDSSYYFGVEFPDLMTIEKIEASLPGSRLKRQYSSDGETWTDKATTARYVRYINTDAKPQSVRLSKLSIAVMPSQSNIAAISDGDLRSAYTISGTLTLDVPEGTTSITVLGEQSSKADVEGYCNALPLIFQTQKIPNGTKQITITNASGKIREIIWKTEK